MGRPHVQIDPVAAERQSAPDLIDSRHDGRSHASTQRHELHMLTAAKLWPTAAGRTQDHRPVSPPPELSGGLPARKNPEAEGPAPAHRTPAPHERTPEACRCQSDNPDAEACPDAARPDGLTGKPANGASSLIFTRTWSGSSINPSNTHARATEALASASARSRTWRSSLKSLPGKRSSAIGVTVAHAVLFRHQYSPVVAFL